MDKWWTFEACPHPGLGWWPSPQQVHFLSTYSKTRDVVCSDFILHLLQFLFQVLPPACVYLIWGWVGAGPWSLLRHLSSFHPPEAVWQVINKTCFVCLPTANIISPVQGERAVFKFLKTHLAWLYPYRSWHLDKIFLSLVPFHKSWQKEKPFMMSVQLISR